MRRSGSASTEVITSKEKNHTMTSNGEWTPEAIRALGPTTDLPTAGDIFQCSRWKSYQMARNGEWEQLGIKVLPIGSKYRVVVQSILNVLGYGSADPGSRESRTDSAPDQASADGARTAARILPASVTTGRTR
jgi:hypothetical protein